MSKKNFDGITPDNYEIVKSAEGTEEAGHHTHPPGIETEPAWSRTPDAFDRVAELNDRVLALERLVTCLLSSATERSRARCNPHALK